MELIVNGKKTDCNDGATVSDLLETLDVGKDAQGVAIAVNDAVVPREKWALARLSPGDRIEIIHAVQGG